MSYYYSWPVRVARATRDIRKKEYDEVKENKGGQYGSSVPHMNVNYASVIHKHIVILRAL